MIYDHHQPDLTTSFLIKSMTLNADSPTKRVINSLIKAYKAAYPNNYTKVTSAHPEFFVGRMFKKSIEEIVNYYKTDLFSSDDEIRIGAQNIRRVAKLVKRFMQSQDDSIQVDTHLYGQLFVPSYSAAFHGHKAVEAERTQFEAEMPSADL